MHLVTDFFLRSIASKSKKSDILGFKIQLSFYYMMSKYFKNPEVGSIIVGLFGKRNVEKEYRTLQKKTRHKSTYILN